MFNLQYFFINSVIQEYVEELKRRMTSAGHSFSDLVSSFLGHKAPTLNQTQIKPKSNLQPNSAQRWWQKMLSRGRRASSKSRRRKRRGRRRRRKKKRASHLPHRPVLRALPHQHLPLKPNLRRQSKNLRSQWSLRTRY